MQEMRVWSLDWKDPLQKEMATHSSILAWRIPWTEEPGGVAKSWTRLKQLSSSNDKWCWASFRGLDALCVSPSVKRLFRSFAHLFKWLVFLFSFKYSFCISEYKSLIRYVIYIYFLPVCVLSWDCEFLKSSLGDSASLVQSPRSD